MAPAHRPRWRRHPLPELGAPAAAATTRRAQIQSKFVTHRATQWKHSKCQSSAACSYDSFAGQVPQRCCSRHAHTHLRPGSCLRQLLGGRLQLLGGGRSQHRRLGALPHRHAIIGRRQQAHARRRRLVALPFARASSGRRVQARAAAAVVRAAGVVAGPQLPAGAAAATAAAVAAAAAAEVTTTGLQGVLLTTPQGGSSSCDGGLGALLATWACRLAAGVLAAAHAAGGRASRLGKATRLHAQRPRLEQRRQAHAGCWGRGVARLLRLACLCSCTHQTDEGLARCRAARRCWCEQQARSSGLDGRLLAGLRSVEPQAQTCALLVGVRHGGLSCWHTLDTWVAARGRSRRRRGAAMRHGRGHRIWRPEAAVGRARQLRVLLGAAEVLHHGGAGTKLLRAKKKRVPILLVADAVCVLATAITLAYNIQGPGQPRLRSGCAVRQVLRTWAATRRCSACHFACNISKAAQLGSGP